jgi:NADH dehydrogenase
VRAALDAAGVELQGGARVDSLTPGGVNFGDGARIAAATAICATGMRGSPLAATLRPPLDDLGRLPLDALLRVEGMNGIYAAGDVARAWADGAGHATAVSCQHARPMGRVAGHNAVCDLPGLETELVSFAAESYVTVLDLGPWGAVYTSGWDRGQRSRRGSGQKRRSGGDLGDINRHGDHNLLAFGTQNNTLTATRLRNGTPSAQWPRSVDPILDDLFGARS